MPVDSTYTTHREVPREQRQAEYTDNNTNDSLDEDDIPVSVVMKPKKGTATGGKDRKAQNNSRDVLSDAARFAAEFDEDLASEEDEPEKPNRLQKVVAKASKTRNKEKQEQQPKRTPGRAAAASAHLRKRKAPDTAPPKTPARPQHRRHIDEEQLKRMEEEIMHGGKYFKIRDEHLEREKARKDAIRNKMEGREHVDRATRPQEVSVLDERQQRIKELCTAFYSVSRAPNVALGEILTLVPQHNIGYIEILGDDKNIPQLLRKDPNFTSSKSKFSRKILFDGTSLLHQSCLVGDLVAVEFERLFQGTDVSKEERRWRREEGNTTNWIATRITEYTGEGHSNMKAIPFKSQIIPLEVRKYMLTLLTLLEGGQDLSLYVKIVQELEIWRRILGEEYTNKPHGGLMRWHVLLILSIASRHWLEDADMPILLWSFFNSFTGSRFLTDILPSLLQNESSSSVLLNLAQFCYLYKKHTGESVNHLYPGLREKVSRLRKDDPSAERFKAVVKKLESVLGELTSFVGLLKEACQKGYNTLRIKNKEQLEMVDEILAAERTGHSTEADGIDPLPTLREIGDEEALDPSRLPMNRVSGSWGSPEEYARASFQLLRADTYKEFQFSMYHKSYQWQRYESTEDVEYKREVGNPTTFTRLVSILGVNYIGSTLAGRLCYTVRFRLSEPMQEAWMWRLFGLGNLVGLTTDRFKSNVWWAVVSHRDQALITQGIVGLEFISGDPLDLEHRLGFLRDRAQDTECWLVEARGIFFSGYRPVLEALQQFARKAHATGHCPFEEYLVYGKDAPKMPPWVEHNKDDFDRELQLCIEENTFDPSQERAVRGLVNNFLLVQGPPGTGKSYTGVKMVEVILRTRYAVLDKMQHDPATIAINDKLQEARKAVQEYQELQAHCERLKNDVLLLKTKRDKARGSKEKMKFRKDIDRILKEREKFKRSMHDIDTQQSVLFTEVMELEQQKEEATRDWARDSGPIQIITYKNHSLDEFLMDVKPALRDSTEDPTRKEGIVRFGSRSQCEELMQYNVIEHVRRYEAESNIMAYYKLLNSSLRSKVDALKNLGAEISHLQGGNLTPECLKCNMTEQQALYFGEVTEAKIEAWRGVPMNEVLVSLEDAARAALQEDLERKGDDSDSEDDGMPHVSDFQGQRDIYQTKLEQENEEKARLRFMNGFSPVMPDMPFPKLDPFTINPEDFDDLMNVPRERRNALAKFWIQRHLRAVMQQYQRLKYEYIYLVASQQEFKEQIKVDALQHAQVIGLTTTGCTINKELLNRVRPTILIVEEAAEILESQILSCLGQESIQQVVLVGDHKQLRPIVNSYALARDCRLDLSLFERMANNGVPVHNLTNQRRMVPQISQFVRPLYRQLIDDPCLKPRKMHCDLSGEIREAGNIPGLGKPVWFWTHETPEERSQIGLSVVNPMETRMVVWLVKYFTARGMSLNQITVLTPYKGQLRELKDALEMADCSRKDMVCTVDRFQGDENDLMIVSLVRTQKLTEFIKAPDRMCVLLSRARFGMIILGSSTLLDSGEVPHWQQTMGTLQKNSWIGAYFPLVCDRHPRETEQKLMLQDLLKSDSEVKVEGFCTKPCGAHFTECKKKGLHVCKRICHPGEHTVCPYPCDELLPCGHRCKQECGECVVNKGCKCMATVTEPSPNCGVSVFCSTTHRWVFEPHVLSKICSDRAFKPCKRTIYVRCPQGKHFVKTYCHIHRLPQDHEKRVKQEQCLDCIRDLPAVELDPPFTYDNKLPPVLDFDPKVTPDGAFRNRGYTREEFKSEAKEEKPEESDVDVSAMLAGDLMGGHHFVTGTEEKQETEDMTVDALPAEGSVVTALTSQVKAESEVKLEELEGDNVKEEAAQDGEEVKQEVELQEEEEGTVKEERYVGNGEGEEEESEAKRRKVA